MAWDGLVFRLVSSTFLTLRYLFKTQANTIHPHQLGDDLKLNTIHPHQLGDDLKLRKQTGCQRNVVDDYYDENQENL